MDLIKQFPDITMNGRDKFLLQRKMDQQKSEGNKGLSRFYNNELRKWHIKLIFIIVLLFAVLYFIAFNLPFSN